MAETNFATASIVEGLVSQPKRSTGKYHCYRGQWYCRLHNFPHLLASSSPMHLKTLVVERTGGNPFFMEEIVQTLFDEGVLVRNGAMKVTRSLSQVRLPPTVQGIL